MLFRYMGWGNCGNNSEFISDKYFVVISKFWKNHFRPKLTKEIPVNIFA